MSRPSGRVEHTATFWIPVGALQCMVNLRRMSQGGHLMCIAADKVTVTVRVRVRVRSSDVHRCG